jgi:transposase
MGLDVGEDKSYAVILDPEGKVIWEGTLKTRESSVRKALSGVPRIRVALEGGNHSMWLSRLLEELGHEVLVANARKLRLIYENRRKQDRVDAEYLARLARVDPKLLSPIQHRRESYQQDLQMLRSREILIQNRTKLINHVRSGVKLFGKRLPKCSAAAFAKKVGAEIPAGLQETLEPILDVIAGLTQQIKQYDARVEELCTSKYPETEALLQIRGVGYLTALAYVLTLESHSRFEKSRHVGAFLGLCPRRDQSSDRDPELRIHKQGDRFLRQLLVTCAHYILGPFGEDCDLRRHGEKIAQRGGKKAKKRAVVAVARKLSVLMHRLWRTQEVYDPLYNENRRAA